MRGITVEWVVVGMIGVMMVEVTPCWMPVAVGPGSFIWTVSKLFLCMLNTAVKDIARKVNDKE